MVNVSIYGDSILKGVIYDDKTKKYSLFSDRYLIEYEENGINVQNNSHMGATIEKGYNLITSRIKAQNENDIVLIGYGGNDCNFEWSDISNIPVGEYTPKTSPEKFIQLYIDAIKHIKSFGAKAVAVNLIPLEPKKFMSWISRGLSYDNILNWLGDLSALYRWQEYYNHLVEEIAREFECPLIDIRTPFLQNRTFSSLYCADGIHPNRDGHKIIRQTLREYAEIYLLPTRMLQNKPAV